MQAKLNIYLLLFVLILGFACSKKDSKNAQPSEPLVATVNGDRITKRQFIEKAERLQNQLNINMDVYKEKRKLLNDIISARLIYQKALSENVDKDPEFKELIANYYLKKHFPGKSISDKEAEKYFDAHKAKYESIRVRHILIKSLKENNKKYEDLARKQAGELLVKLLNGEDFAELAKQYSHDQGSSKNGGDLGYFKRGQMVKGFEDAAFSLKEPGDLSKIIKTKFGFHIIKLIDKKTGFLNFKNQIKQTLLLGKNRDKFSSLIKGLREDAQIIVNEDVLKEVKIFQEPMLLK